MNMIFATISKELPPNWDRHEVLALRISSFSQFAKESIHVPHFRRCLLSHVSLQEVVGVLNDIARLSTGNMLNMTQLRLLRGIALVVGNGLNISRNDVIENPEFLNDLADFGASFLRCVDAVAPDSESKKFYEDLFLPSVYKCLSNVWGNFEKIRSVGSVAAETGAHDDIIDNSDSLDDKTSTSIALLLHKVLSNLCVTKAGFEPFCVMLVNIANNGSANILNEFVANDAFGGSFRVLIALKDNFEGMASNEDMNQELANDGTENDKYDDAKVSEQYYYFNCVSLLHGFLERLCLNPFFGDAIAKIYLEDQQNFTDSVAQELTLKLYPVDVVASILPSDPTNDQLRSILPWLTRFYVILQKDIEQLFKGANINVPLLYASITTVLELLSKYCITRYSLLVLNGELFFKRLVQLLKLIHENIPQISKLGDAKAAEIHPPEKFPNVKKLLVETISYFLIDSFNNQETLRIEGGLAVLLSCCTIDQLNPYIKEASIVAIRFALAGNINNQDFVRQLEARKVVNEEELAKYGMEVEIKNGEVNFKK